MLGCLIWVMLSWELDEEIVHQNKILRDIMKYYDFLTPWTQQNIWKSWLKI